MNPVPDIIQEYISAQNSHNVDQRLLCFTPNATVHDEGELLVGYDAIKQWMFKTEAKYKQTLRPLRCREHEDEVILTAETSGAFEGSPLDLDFHFTITGGHISNLEVKVSPPSKERIN